MPDLIIQLIIVALICGFVYWAWLKLAPLMPIAEPFASILVAGAPLAVRGHELTTKHGSVVDARAMGKDESSLTEIAKPPKPSKHDEKTPKKDHPPKHHAAHH